MVRKWGGGLRITTGTITLEQPIIRVILGIRNMYTLLVVTLKVRVTRGKNFKK